MFDPFWTDLIKKNQKVNRHFYPFCICDIYTDFLDWWEIQFDTFLADLIPKNQK